MHIKIKIILNFALRNTFKIFLTELFDQGIVWSQGLAIPVFDIETESLKPLIYLISKEKIILSPRSSTR